MSLALLDSRETTEGIAVTFITDYGLEELEGSCEEVARLAQVMQQVSVLATLNDSESVWVDEVVVGDATVKLGLNPGGLTRMLIERLNSYLGHGRIITLKLVPGRVTERADPPRHPRNAYRGGVAARRSRLRHDQGRDRRAGAGGRGF